jgi:hypothetical protein
VKERDSLVLLLALAVQGGLGAGEVFPERGDGAVRGGERRRVLLPVLLAAAGGVVRGGAGGGQFRGVRGALVLECLRGGACCFPGVRARWRRLPSW